MTRRLSIAWPSARPFAGRDGRPIRLLAISDEEDRALERAANREALGAIDLVIGCGDLPPPWLCFVADAFRAPLVYVRGNHDRQGPWPEPRELPVPAAGLDTRWMPGIELFALPWPAEGQMAARRDERDAWSQVLRLGWRRLVRPGRETLVVSHVPPRGAGDTPSDAYHVGFAAYRLAARRLRPALWLHGHTNLAAQAAWRVERGPTTFVNATGSVLVELRPPIVPPEAPADPG